MQVYFHINSIEDGWIEITLGIEDDEITITASYLSDAPSELLSALAILCEGFKETACMWQEEPGEYWWQLRREGDLIELKIVFLIKSFSRKNPENGQVVFYGKENLVKFAKSIAKEFNRIKYNLTADEYRKRWGHEFPYKVLCRLGAAIKGKQI